MQVRFWGTRGSIPVPGEHTVRYGGNTSCVEVRSAAGTTVVIDRSFNWGKIFFMEGLCSFNDTKIYIQPIC